MLPFHHILLPPANELGSARVASANNVAKLRYSCLPTITKTPRTASFVVVVHVTEAVAYRDAVAVLDNVEGDVVVVDTGSVGVDACEAVAAAVLEVVVSPVVCVQRLGR